MSITGERIRVLRQRSKLRQDDLARQLGIKQGQLSMYERIVPPPIDIVIKAAEIFNCSTDYLMGLTDDPIQLTADDREFIRWLRGLPTEPTAKQIEDFLISQHTAKKPRPRRSRQD